MRLSSSEIPHAKALFRRLATSRGRMFLRRCSEAFLLAGLLALGYCACLWATAHVFQAYQSWHFDHLWRSGGAEKTARALSRGSLVGRIEIRRIGISAMVLEGADARTLGLAVGHIPGTALPGQSGNVGIAGHRDTFFRGLRKIRNNDTITLRTPTGSYSYRVESAKVVGPTRTQVLQASPKPTLTLVTCYPFYFVGAAPDRFVVRARQDVPQRSSLSRDARKTAVPQGVSEIVYNSP